MWSANDENVLRVERIRGYGMASTIRGEGVEELGATVGLSASAARKRENVQKAYSKAEGCRQSCAAGKGAVPWRSGCEFMWSWV